MFVLLITRNKEMVSTISFQTEAQADVAYSKFLKWDQNRIESYPDNNGGHKNAHVLFKLY